MIKRILIYVILFLSISLQAIGQKELPVNKWSYIEVGSTRVKWGDFNSNGIHDIAVSEKRFSGTDPDANLYVFIGQQGSKPTCKQTTIITQYSINNLDAADVDNERDLDVISGNNGDQNTFVNNSITPGNTNYQRIPVSRFI